MDSKFFAADRKLTTGTGTLSVTAMVIKWLMAACLLCQTSCAQVDNFSKEPGADNTPAILQDIKILKNNTQIIILANKPLKYRLYNIAEPPRAVVDLYSDVLSPFKTPVKTSTSLVSQIDIIKQKSDGRTFTRIIFKLKRSVDFSAQTGTSSAKEIILTVAEPGKRMKTDVERERNGSVPNDRTFTNR